MMLNVDARGDACPLPVVKAKKAIAALNGAGEVEVLVDNEIAVQNLTRMAGGHHLTAKAEKIAEKEFVVTMEVTAPVGDAPWEEPELACAPDMRGNFVVAVDTDAMGRGSEELGRTLMKGFLFAVSQLPVLPKTMLFYNGIPHLLIPVVTDPKKAAGALQWAVFEMMKRYKTFSEHGVKKLEEYNRLARATS